MFYFYKLHEISTVIKSETGIDILDKTREREKVYLRAIFSNIALKLKYSKSKIGRFLLKNHATIIHYETNVLSFALQEYNELYQLLNELFLKDKNIKVELQLIDKLKTENIELRKELLKLRQKGTPNEIRYKMLSPENKEKVDIRLDAILTMIERQKKLNFNLN